MEMVALQGEFKVNTVQKTKSKIYETFQEYFQTYFNHSILLWWCSERMTAKHMTFEMQVAVQSQYTVLAEP